MELISMLLIAMILYTLQKWLYKKCWDKGLEADISFQGNAAIEGEKAFLKETISNKKMLPLPMLHVKFQLDRNLKFVTAENSAVTDLTYRNDVFSVLPWQKITRTLTFKCVKRGYYRCDRIDMVAHDIFITENLPAFLPISTSMYVYPSAADAERLSIPFYQVMGSVLARKQLSEDPFEFRGIREYQSYDSMREVNWKATAKTGELKVNLHESTASQKVMILLNFESDYVWPDQALREESIRIAASMMQEFTAAGVPVSLYSNGTDLFTGEPVFIPAGAGNEHTRVVLETLSRIQYEKELQPFAEFLKGRRKEAEMGGTLYLLISSSQNQDMLMEYAELCARSPESVWIAPLRPEEELSAGLCPKAAAMKWVVENDKK